MAGFFTIEVGLGFSLLEDTCPDGGPDSYRGGSMYVVIASIRLITSL